jgi:hypothetical protein
MTSPPASPPPGYSGGVMLDLRSQYDLATATTATTAATASAGTTACITHRFLAGIDVSV